MTAPDKHTRSVWLPTTPQTNYPSLSSELSVDVAVIGAGISGLSAAYELIGSGLSVAVIEAECVGYGVTSHSTAKLTALHRLVYAELEEHFDAATAETYAAANQAGIQRIASLVENQNISCDFERQAAYTFTCEDEYVDALRREAVAAARAGLVAEFVTDTELPFEVKGAVKVADQAQFDPYRYCVGLARAVREAGGHIFEHTRATGVIDINKKDDTCTVQTTHGNVRANHVVLATLLPFLDRGGLFARTHPSRSYGIAVELDGPACDGMYISAESPVRSVRRMADRRSLIVVGEDHKVGQDSDTRLRYAALESWARKNFSVASIHHRWSAQDYMPADGLPFIGPLPLSSGRLLVVTGLNKWGLAIGAGSAAILVDIVHGRDNPWAATFDPRRVNALASAKAMVVENLDVAKRFVGDRLSTLAAKEVSALSAGEGGIAYFNGERVAAYRDSNGQLHVCSPICTHMGCYVLWNTAEKSWDCPCHGSRFGVDGQVLQGPAVSPLAAVTPTPQ